MHTETPLNINLNINNERQDCKNRYSMCLEGTSGRGEGEKMKKIKVRVYG
jgi:hypothetical protein